MQAAPPLRGPLTPLRAAPPVRSAPPRLGVIDSFSGSASSALATADNGGTWVLTGGAANQWSEAGGLGICTPGAAGGTVRSQNLPCYHKDGDFYLDFSVDTQAVGGNQIVFLWLRCQSTANLTDYGARFRCVLGTSGVQAQMGQVTRNVAGAGTGVGPAATLIPGDVAPGQLMRLHVYMEGAFYGLNIYDAATAEPAGWLMSFTDDKGYLDGVGLAIGQQSLAGNTNLSPVRFDNLQGSALSAIPAAPAPTPLTLSAAITANAFPQWQTLASRQATIAAVGAIARQAAKQPSVSMAASPVVQKQAAKLYPAAATTVGAGVQKQAAKLLPVAGTTVGAVLQKQPGALRQAAASALAAIQKTVGKQPVSSITTAASIQKQVGKRPSASIVALATVVTVKASSLTLTCSSATVATIRKQGGRVAAAAVGAVALIQRQPAKQPAAVVTTVPTIQKQVGKRPAAGSGMLATIGTIKASTLTLTAAIAGVATIRRQAAKAPTAAATVLAVLSRQTAKQPAAAVVVVPRVQRQTGKRIGAVVAPSGTIQLSPAKQLRALVTGIATIASSILSGASGFVTGRFDAPNPASLGADNPQIATFTSQPTTGSGDTPAAGGFDGPNPGVGL